MIKPLKKYSLISLVTILLMVPATVSISQFSDMEKTNLTLNIPPALDSAPLPSEFKTGTTHLLSETAGKTPATIFLIGIGLITVAGIMRKNLEKTIPLNFSTPKKKHLADYDRPVLSQR